MCIFVRYRMEITSSYIEQLLMKVDAFFTENIDSGFAVSKPSEYVIKPVSELSSSPSYDEIWDTGNHLSAAQLTNFLLSNSDKYNFWDFQLVKVKSSSMCIILFLNYYLGQKELGGHCGIPSIYCLDFEYGPGDKCIFLIVKSVIDELDLFGLLKGRAPSDEYDIESRNISHRISKNRTPEEIAYVIAEEFNKYYDLHSQPSEYIKPATKIKELLQPKEVRDSSDGEDTVS